ncbi:MAG: rayT [Phycisphaerales bacterium]|nr:rayT [Phycisphaerales bacterium]
MGRPRRLTAGGVVYHVINRANRRAKIFHKHRDYQAFIEIVAQGLERTPCRVLGLCLMPNHWHLVLRPHADGDLSRLMAWISNTHVKRYGRGKGAKHDSCKQLLYLYLWIACGVGLISVALHI